MRIGFFLFNLFSRILAKLPKRAMYLFADLLSFTGYYMIQYRKKVVFENLQNAFPEKDPKEIRTIAKKFYKHLGDVMIENIAMLHMNPERLDQFVKISNLQLLNNLYKQKKNVMGILGHYANWELLTTLPLNTPYTILSIYKPLKNKFFDKKIFEMRKRFNEVPVPMKQAYKTIAQYQQSGLPYTVGMVADQSPPKKDIHFRTKFLNQDTAFFLGAAKIAKKYQHTIIFPAVKKRRRGSYEIIFSPLVNDTDGITAEEIMERYVRALENLIKEQPQYWLWSHRRWKHTKGARNTD
jgi:KDO2-lipid IV(A) lauroyltransferase